MRFARLSPATAVMFLALNVGVIAYAQSPDTLTLPPYSTVTLDNGMTLLLMEHHEVPIVSLSFIVKTGSVADPVGKEGVATLVGDLLRKGTLRRSSEQISTELDFIGARFSVNAGLDYTSGSAEFLRKDLTNGVELVADMVLNPTFVPEEVAKLIAQHGDALRSAKDRANRVIGPYFKAYLFGDHPYGRPVAGDENSIGSISRDDITSFYESYYTPENTILAAVGDFAIPEMRDLIEEHFAAWPQRATPEMLIDEPRPVRGDRVLLVDKPDSTQTYFYIGNLGVSRTHPDRVPIGVVNTFFGGRFTSRLNTALRVESGLTYGAGSRFELLEHAGPFLISSYTRNDTTEEAIDMALRVLGALHEEGIGANQLESVKTYIKGQFPTRIETSDRLASTIAQLEFYGLDAADIDNYYAEIDAVSMEDVRRVVGQYFPLDDLVFVLVGKASDIESVVRKYGPTLDRKSVSDPGY